MPVHHAIAARFHYLDGITSFLEAYSKPEQRQQIQKFDSWVTEVEPPSVVMRMDTVPGPHGPVPVRIYGPEAGSTTERPALVWVHGGGFVGGDLDMREADWTAREVCARAGATVVSVDYRLAIGGVSYPVPHDDVVAAVKWTREHAAALGIDPLRICIGGASAGGNLAAGAALRLRDRDGWLPAALMLVYPTLHPVVPPASRSLMAALDEVPSLFRLTSADSARMHMDYLGGPLSSADGYAMPGLAVLDGLCPTVVLNAEYDVLRSSGENFAAAAALAGVDVQQFMIPGMLHGFLNLPPMFEPVQRALALISNVVMRHATNPIEATNV